MFVMELKHQGRQRQRKRMSLQNKHLGNGDYFGIIASSSHPMLLKEHAATGLVQAPLKYRFAVVCSHRR